MKQKNINLLFGLLLLIFTCQLSYGQGSGYTGSYRKSSPVRHEGTSNVVIDGLEISSTGNASCIAIYNSENVVIKNCKLGPSPLTRAIYLYRCKNVTITDCTFENVQSGLLAVLSQGIKFEYNDVTNLLGSIKGAKEDYEGVMVQFNQVSGAGNSISHNACENLPGESSTEDIINLFNSAGTQQSPIMVKGNWIRGGGPSDSGGGINLGDWTGSYQIAEGNILVDPGQYGVGISGGNNLTLRNNKIFAKRQPFTNVGIGVANWHARVGQSHSMTVENNIVNFTNKDGVANSFWFYDNVGPITGRETNKYDSNLTASILPAKIIGRARSSTPPAGEETDPSQPVVENDPSIVIYLDTYNRACVNVSGPLLPSASVIESDRNGTVIYNQVLSSFHTVLPQRPAPGNYTIVVSNGNKTNKKTLNIP